jgi:hypothetical protein
MSGGRPLDREIDVLDAQGRGWPSGLAPALKGELCFSPPDACWLSMTPVFAFCRAPLRLVSRVCDDSGFVRLTWTTRTGGFVVASRLDDVPRLGSAVLPALPCSG